MVETEILELRRFVRFHAHLVHIHYWRGMACVRTSRLHHYQVLDSPWLQPILTQIELSITSCQLMFYQYSRVEVKDKYRPAKDFSETC